MLKKIYRGLKRSDFGEILGIGKTIQTPLFGVRYQQNSETKIGWIISKKISKRAVDRNKIKRRLAEVIKNKIPKDIKLIILVKKNIMEAKIEEIDKCWQIVYEKMGIKTTNSL